MTPEEKAVVEAVGRFFGGNGLFVLGDWVALENANRAYHKSLEPPRMWNVHYSCRGVPPSGAWTYVSGPGGYGHEVFAIATKSPELAERIAALLNKSEV